MVAPILKSRFSLRVLIAASIGILGVWAGHAAPVFETDDPCSSASDSACSFSTSRQWVEAAGVGGISAAIALGTTNWALRKYTEKSRSTESSAADGERPVAGHDLERVQIPRSATQTLTPQQREVLQCLLVLGAIAPDAVAAPSSPPAPSSLRLDRRQVLDASLRSLSRSDIRHLLSQFGFSKRAIDQAWRIINEQ